jgi:beta-lactamase family protein
LKFVAGVALALSSSALILFALPGARSAFTSTTLATSTKTATATPTATPTAAPTPPPKPAPASALGVVGATCFGGTDHSVRITFVWRASGAGPQWLDLSIFGNGFAPGTFVTATAFSPQGWGYRWDGLLEGTTHFVRVNTLTRSGWMASDTLPFYTPICSGRTDPAPAPDMLGLRDEIAAAVADSPINTAVAITDLRTGETVDVNGSQPRLPGCTINLFALFQAVSDLEVGAYLESSVGDTIGQTINRSDPILARGLTRDFVGGGDLVRGMSRVNNFMHGLGMTSTFMDHAPAFPEESYLGMRDNSITALDSNRGLQALWGDRVLNPWWRVYFLDKMTLVKPGLNYLIPAGVSASATVSHKNGFLWSEGWADNDIGIVWFERGGQRYGYAISFFTQAVPQKYDDIPLGQQISSLAYQWFVGRYGYP